MVLTIVGGASGVGKTSLLRSFADIKQVNTGDLFKLEMLIGNRDEIRKGDWSVFEAGVADNMARIVADATCAGEDLIIDTHFGAKIYNKEYRIGLKEEYIFQFGLSVFSRLTNNLAIKVVLITTDPFLLLTRRRLDKSRNRELVPSDCYNDLRSNNIYSLRYYSAIRRAESKSKLAEGITCDIEYRAIENNVFESAHEKIGETIRR